jgi:nitrate reductase NapE component
MEGGEGDNCILDPGAEMGKGKGKGKGKREVEKLKFFFFLVCLLVCLFVYLVDGYTYVRTLPYLRYVPRYVQK